MTTSLQFLSGGGEMGALMRAYNWESSPIGSADKWPQNLRTTLGILLNSKFPMFLYWGPNLVCFYNDAYRFSLGNDGKHPLILGMKGEEAWNETWYLLKPSIDQVIYNGEATWSEDQLIPIYREGEMKDAYWTFSFSPVKDESNQTAGVFLTLIETTEKVNNLKKLIEANDQLAFAIEATELGTFDLNPLTNKFIGNNRLKDWFGLPHYMEVDLTLAINVMVEKDRSRVAGAIQKTLEYKSGGLYDIEYSILNPVTKQERIVRAKGRAWFGDDKIAYRFNGTLQDITEQTIARRKTEISEAKFRNLILQAPVLINTLIGASFIVDTINKTALEIWGKPYEKVINKPLFESAPELEESMKKILSDVYNTGETFIAKEIPVQLKRLGKPDTAYFDTVYQPLRDLDNKIYGIITIGTEITESVNARKLIEASEKRFSNILSQSIMAIGILKGTDMVIESVNEPLLKIWGKGPEIVGKPLFEVISELKSQQFPKQLNDVYTTGIAYTFNENRAIILNDGKPEEHFFSVVIQPYTEVDGTISGVTVIGTETTEQVLAKKQIEESEARFRNLIWQAPVLVATYRGPSFIIETVNKSAIQAWGKSYEELVNKPLFEVSPELEEGLKTILNDIYTTGEPFINNEIAVEIICLGKPTIAYFNMLYQPLRDLDNKIYAIMLIGTEVTESVNARKLIEASEEFNRTVLESSPDCLKVIDIEGRIQFMNVNGLYQLEIDDFSTFKNKNWVSFWGSENEALAKASIDKALTGATAQFIALSLTAKGTPKWWDVVVSPVVKSGEQVQQIISVSRDITEKKKAEEAIENLAAYLKLATDSANVGTWSLNIQTQELEWSALHKKIWGYNEQNKNLTYEDWHKAIVPEDVALAFQKIEESRVNNSIYEVDYRIKRANDGAVVWIK